MLKKLMITTALGTMVIGAAAAQTPSSSDTTTAPTASTTAPASGDAKFINSQSPDQWLSSSFIGVDVIGPDDAKIGDVADILFDKNGNVVGYIVGVGGFLGIGAKNVALAPSSFQVMPAAAGTTGSTTGTTASSDDVKLKLNMTKDQLQQAASFESKREQDAKARAASQPAPGGGGTSRPAPK
ncbi:PRC-barrel domain-containing protein [Pseudorhodoplanes sinuspersici]|uniref:Uncharacterized protein n=1 Tax=Pseudorhodoplanes sinuspersici TaxID=1235591 RepID=A0A1W6ZTC4_9HYPH|nr:PRC-barrel domain-containing protein [Pseudorhodoplanes sinuspersici]ARP99994.1 hypothetical protein CAK95_13545 [Pseudorhodoplanes sinuspersici]RKE71025.1 PRC-barrel domain protein [Pseudorhodoplanes sinuspersici]